jgi:carbonic anhydrase
MNPSDPKPPFKTPHLAFLFLVFTVLVPNSAWAQWKTHWTYEGATGVSHWGDLDPDYAPCKTGKEQSPIVQRNRLTHSPSYIPTMSVPCNRSTAAS